MRYPAILVLAGILLCTACGEESNDSSSGADTQKVEVSKGEQIFRSSCMACHGLDEARIGPALKGTFANWNYDTARITAFKPGASPPPVRIPIVFCIICS